jgi:hypothetical protein
MVEWSSALGRCYPDTTRDHPRRRLTRPRSGTVILVLLGRAQLLSSRRFRGGVRGDGKMTFRAICVALLLSCLSTAGCGTVANLAHCRPEEGGRSPFGGVQQDLSCFREAANGELGFRSHPKSNAEDYPQVALMMFCAADLPFSLLGDVLTWPYTCSYTFINQPVPVPPIPLAGPPTIQVIPTPPATQPMPIPVPPPGTKPPVQGMPLPAPSELPPIPPLPSKFQ